MVEVRQKEEITLKTVASRDPIVWGLQPTPGKGFTFSWGPRDLDFLISRYKQTIPLAGSPRKLYAFLGCKLSRDPIVWGLKHYYPQATDKITVVLHRVTR